VVNKANLPLAGVHEASEILGWDKRKISTYLKRSEEKGFPFGMFPEPVQRLAGGPVWESKKIESYRDQLLKKQGGGRMNTVASVKFEWIGKSLQVKSIQGVGGHEVVTSTPGQIRPKVIIENEMVVGFDSQGVDLVFPDFDPFPLPADGETHKFSEREPFKKGIAWDETMKYTNALYDRENSRLFDDYKERIEALQDELKSIGKPDLEKTVIEALNEFTQTFKKTGILDYAAVARAFS